MPNIEVYRVSVPVEVADKTTSTVERLEKAFDALDRRVVRPVVDTRDVDHGHSVASSLHSTLDRLGRTNVRVRVSLLDNATGPLRSVFSLVGGPLGLLGGGALAAASIAWPLKLAGNLEQTLVSYKTFLGSQEKAIAFQKQMESLADISPFKTETLERDAIGLLNVSRSAAFTMRTLTDFGNTASATGAGEERMSLALLGFTQIANKGRAQMEEINQVTENLGISAGDVAREMGLTGAQLADIGNQSIPAQRAMEAILRVMERAPYAGGMALQAKTLNGLLSTLRDTGIRTVRAFGLGLADELVPRLQAAVGWTDKNKDAINGFQASLTELGRAVMSGPLSFLEARLGDFNRMITTEMWREGTGSERAQLFWQRVVIDPFNAWWMSGGEARVRGVASTVGGAFGGFLGGSLATMMGVGAESDDAFTKAGQAAASSFTRAFVDAFSLSGITEKIVNWFRDPANGMTLTWDPNSGILGAAARGEGFRFGNRGGPLGHAFDAAADAVLGPNGTSSAAGGRAAGGASADAQGRVFPVQGYHGDISAHHGTSRGASDIMAPEGTPVLAMEGGRVEDVGSTGPGGNNVTVRGRSGLAYYYAHLRDRVALSVGDAVEAGAALGAVGRTGNAANTPSHLHLGIGRSIQSGVGPEGGAGTDYDAVGALRSTLGGRAGPDAPAMPGDDRTAFLQRLSPLAQQSSARTGIPADVYLAIAANESNFGRAGGNSLFGVKGRGVDSQTWEAGPNGERVPTRASFQSYDTPQAAFEAFDNLITSGRYADAYHQFQQDHDVGSYLANLQRAGYATDPNWARSIQSIADTTVKRGVKQNALGGVLSEPIEGVGVSGQRYSFAENGPERVVPMGRDGGGGGITITGPLSFTIPISLGDGSKETIDRAALQLRSSFYRVMTEDIARGRGNVALGVSGT